MSYAPSEKASVENPCVKYATDRKVKVLKVNPLWAAGWPDRVFFIPGGKPLIIEFKRPGGKTSKRQDEIIAELIKDGYDVQVVDNKEEGKALIRARLEANGIHEEGNPVAPRKSSKRAVPRSRAAKD